MYFPLKTILFGSTLMLSTLAMAQPEPGTFSIIPKAGVSTTTLVDDNTLVLGFARVKKEDFKEVGFIPLNPYTEESTGSYSSTRYLNRVKYRRAYTVGVDVQWQCSEHWALVSGVNYSLQGCRYEKDDFYPEEIWDVKDISIDLHYLSVPVIAKLYLGHGFALNAGAQVNWLMKGNIKSHLGYSFNESGDYVVAFVDKTFVVNNAEAGKVYESDRKSDITDDMKRIEVNLPLGFSYEYGRYVADIRSNVGLTNIYDSESGKRLNVGFTLSLGYRFDFKR